MKVRLMNQIICFSVVVLLSLQGIAFSQDEQPEIDARTTEQIQADLKNDAEKLSKRYKQKILEVDSIYAQQLKNTRNKAVKELRKLQQEVAADDLDEAIRIRDIAKKIDAKQNLFANQSSNELQDLQANLKKLERANKKLDKDKEKALQELIELKKNSLKKLAGTWSGKWGTTRNRCSFKIDENGRVKLSREKQLQQVTTKDGRTLLLGETKRSDQNLELIESGDHIVVLGWSISKKRDPIVDPPDHVGFVFRSKQEAK